MHPDQLDVKRSGLWVARTFVAATHQAHLQPFYSLSFRLVALRGAKHGFRSREVSCDLPRTTNFHQAIAEDLGTFAPWVFAFCVRQKCI